MFFFPTLSHFTLGNGWTGSLGTRRYAVDPPEEGMLHTVVWEGPNCRELSEPIAQGDFPLGEEGLAALRQWLDSQRP